MRPQFRFAFVVFCLIFVLIFTVHLRILRAHIFYELRVAQAKQGRLQQMLWRKQLRLAGLTNPAAISQWMDTGIPDGWEYRQGQIGSENPR